MKDRTPAIELAENAASPADSPLPAHARYAKDEAVLARFGKRQHLRVSTLYNPPESMLSVSSDRSLHALFLKPITQRGFGLLQAIGLTTTLMINWEVITVYVLRTSLPRCKV